MSGQAKSFPTVRRSPVMYTGRPVLPAGTPAECLYLARQVFPAKLWRASVTVSRPAATRSVFASARRGGNSGGGAVTPVVTYVVGGGPRRRRFYASRAKDDRLVISVFSPPSPSTSLRRDRYGFSSAATSGSPVVVASASLPLFSR